MTAPARAGRWKGGWDRFWFAPVPAARFEVFRRLLYAYLWLDVFLVTPFVRQRGSADVGLYEPLLIGRLLPVPLPTDLVVAATMWTVLVGAAIGMAGRSPRLVGAITASAYLQWMLVAFSYGKVNHDRFPLLVALFVAATVDRIDLGDRRPSVPSGWALQMVRVSVVAVYFLSVVAKVRFGGWLWANSATLTQALIRRGTFLGRELIEHPNVVVVSQWAAVAFEVTSPLLLVRHRARWVWWALAVVFHLVTFGLLSIAFYPQLVCLLAFLPLERLVGTRTRVTQPAARKASTTLARQSANAGD
ncbi:MAG: HTTM domain-containing protein [Acidimicrobiales bacterium]